MKPTVDKVGELVGTEERYRRFQVGSICCTEVTSSLVWRRDLGIGLLLMSPATDDVLGSEPLCLQSFFCKHPRKT